MKTVKTACAIVLVCAAFFTAFYGGQKIREEKLNSRPKANVGVMTVWQIDGFEGGIGSRKQFLMEVARGFEKENEGLLVMAVSHTKESAEQGLKEGEFPDLISFSCGTEVCGFTEISVPSEVNDLSAGGKIGGKNYAVPWCRGGYCLIENTKTKDNGEVVVSQAEYTLPFVAAAVNGITAKSFISLPPMRAYEKFTSGKTRFLIGTQRDVHRLNVRGMSAVVTPLTGFNDLFQYIAITSQDAEKSLYAEKFVNYLIGETAQKKLYKIGLFSPYYAVDYQGELDRMQKTKDFKTVSPFTSVDKIKELQAVSVEAAGGNENLLIKIKNILV